MAQVRQNPASPPEKLPKGYKPLNSAQLRLEVPEKPGFHRHWFRGTAGRLAKAQQAGYTFVETDDEYLDINNFDLAGDSKASGSTDMGTRVSVVSGDGAGDNGQAVRLYLMECPESIYRYSRDLMDDEMEKTADTLKGGTVGKGQDGEGRNDASKRYVKQNSISGVPLLTRKT